MAHDVFICHSSKDRSVAVEVCDIIEREGVKCWIAPRDVPTSQDWPDAIMDAIENCKIMVFIYSSNSTTKHVKNEIVNASSERKNILTIKIENLPFSGGLKLFLERLHWIDAFDGPIADYGEKIVKSIRRELNNPGDTMSHLQESRQNSPTDSRWSTNKLIIAYSKAKFLPLDRFDPKTPLEMIKQNLAGDRVLPIMAELTKKQSINEQIKYAKEQRYADVYEDSWAEHELQLIGLHVLYKLYSCNGGLSVKKIYDAGSANCGQYNSLMALFEREELEQEQSFNYFAQDFNPDWEKKFKTKGGRFILESLPMIDPAMKGQCDLLCCTHALHYLSHSPLAIYSSFFSFNQLLKTDGYCYVTVPEKASMPGILDILEKSARDAGFEILESGKNRLIHTLTQEPHNITTFYYLLLRKDRNIDQKIWKGLVGASFYRLNNPELSREFGVGKQSDIKINIRKIEKDLAGIMVERDIYIRLFRYAFDRIRNEWADDVPEVADCSKNLEYYIHDIHTLLTNHNGENPDIRRYQLQQACAGYFFWLVGFFISFDYGETINQEHIEVLKSTLYNNRDIRVDINNLNEEQVARLIKHLYELCQHEKIDLLRAFDDLDYSRCVKVAE